MSIKRSIGDPKRDKERLGVLTVAFFLMLFTSCPRGSREAGRGTSACWATRPAPDERPQAQRSDSDVTVRQLRCEYLRDPLGINVVKPRLEWILESGGRGQKQTAYQVLVAGSAERLNIGQADLWDSGKVKSDQSIHVVYSGKALTSQMRCYWKVRVWDKNGKPTSWSKPAMWSMGLLTESDWQADWIGAPPEKTQEKQKPHNGFHSRFSNSPETPKWVKTSEVVLALPMPQRNQNSKLSPPG